MSLFKLSLLWALSGVVDAHTVITYPGWRGDNLIVNATFPYGMQWQYPCGGIPATTNRTKWPITGGAIAIQPGWFQGHATALIYINLGLGTAGPQGGPPNESFPMVPPFQISGPSNNPYPGTFCLPQVPLPSGINAKVGDEATIQIIETAKHGAAMYNCVDITFAEAADVSDVNATNCFNSSDISFQEPSASSPGTVLVGAESSTSRSGLFTSTATSSACPSQTACPKCNNGDSSVKEGLGMGLPFGVLALGIMGL